MLPPARPVTARTQSALPPRVRPVVRRVLAGLVTSVDRPQCFRSAALGVGYSDVILPYLILCWAAMYGCTACFSDTKFM
eukprot:scaffold73266_cov15-Tisochrysis_lutea.AAC.1